jgi:hypothetical protein
MFQIEFHFTLVYHSFMWLPLSHFYSFSLNFIESWLHFACFGDVYISPIWFHFRTDSRYDRNALGIRRLSHRGDEREVKWRIFYFFVLPSLCFELWTNIHFVSLKKWPHEKNREEKDPKGKIVERGEGRSLENLRCQKNSHFFSRLKVMGEKIVK